MEALPLQQVLTVQVVEVVQVQLVVTDHPLLVVLVVRDSQQH
jgi:hypothetical protein